MARVADDAEAVRREMAQLRQELGGNVRGLASRTSPTAQWKRTVANHAWLALGAAALAGYLIVPKRKLRAPGRTEVSSVSRAEAVDQARQTGHPITLGGALGVAGRVLVPVAVRAAQSYAIAWIERWIAEQHQATTAAGPAPESDDESIDEARPFAY
jgi:hypothetical protein